MASYDTRPRTARRSERNSDQRNEAKSDRTSERRADRTSERRADRTSERRADRTPHQPSHQPPSQPPPALSTEPPLPPSPRAAGLVLKVIQSSDDGVASPLPLSPPVGDSPTTPPSPASSSSTPASPASSSYASSSSSSDSQRGLRIVEAVVRNRLRAQRDAEKLAVLRAWRDFIQRCWQACTLTTLILFIRDCFVEPVSIIYGSLNRRLIVWSLFWTGLAYLTLQASGIFLVNLCNHPVTLVLGKTTAILQIPSLCEDIRMNAQRRYEQPLNATIHAARLVGDMTDPLERFAVELPAIGVNLSAIAFYFEQSDSKSIEPMRQKSSEIRHLANEVVTQGGLFSSQQRQMRRALFRTLTKLTDQTGNLLDEVGKQGFMRWWAIEVALAIPAAYYYSPIAVISRDYARMTQNYGTDLNNLIDDCLQLAALLLELSSELTHLKRLLTEHVDEFADLCKPPVWPFPQKRYRDTHCEPNPGQHIVTIDVIIVYVEFMQRVLERTIFLHRGANNALVNLRISFDRSNATAFLASRTPTDLWSAVFSNPFHERVTLMSLAEAIVKHKAALEDMDKRRLAAEKSAREVVLSWTKTAKAPRSDDNLWAMLGG